MYTRVAEFGLPRQVTDAHVHLISQFDAAWLYFLVAWVSEDFPLSGYPPSREVHRRGCFPWARHLRAWSVIVKPK